MSRSLPLPPMRRSLPAKPLSMSSPASPRIMSSPSPPLSVSPSAEPTILSPVGAGSAGGISSTMSLSIMSIVVALCSPISALLMTVRFRSRVSVPSTIASSITGIAIVWVSSPGAKVTLSGKTSVKSSPAVAVPPVTDTCTSDSIKSWSRVRVTSAPTTVPFSLSVKVG